MGLEKSDSIRNDFSLIVSAFSSLSIFDVSIIALFKSFVVLDLLLLSSSVLLFLFILSILDSLVESQNFAIENSDLTIEEVEFLNQSTSVGFVFLNPVLIISSLNFSGGSNFIEDLVAEIKNGLD